MDISNHIAQALAGMGEPLPEQTVEVGSNQPTVIIDKLFGPLIFADLRITADAKSNAWIIERRWIKSGMWVEWCRIPGQLAPEFAEEEQD